MKKFYATTLLAIGSFLTINTNAQELPDSKPYHKPTVIIGKEKGLSVSNSGEIGFIFKKHLGGDRAFRFRTLRTGLINDRMYYPTYALGVGAAFSFQKLKAIDSKFTYYRGWEPFIASYISLQGFGLYGGVGYNFGLTYDLSEKFNMNVEICPSLGIGMGQNHDGGSRMLILNNSANFISIGVNYKISE